MLRERIVWIVALLVVAGAGFYGGQQYGMVLGRQERANAANAFFNGRAGQGGQGGNFRGGQGGFAGRGLNGTVSAVNGSTITLTARDGSNVQVQLAQNGAVRKQVDGQLADIKAGDRVTAIGTQNGNTFEASLIQVGGGFPGQGGPNAGADGGNQGAGRPTSP
jgi:hypothetical protein